VTDERRAWLPAVLALACVTALFAASAWERWELLVASPFPIGVDGYYYPIQLRELLAHGSLAYAAPPFAFWLMAPLAAITDPIIGAKLGAAIGGAAIAFPAYALGARLGKSRAAGLVAAALATTSAGSAYLTIEFVKNGIGLTVALAALVFALRAIDRPSALRIIVALVAVVAAWLTHKMGAAVAAIALPAAIAEAIGRGALRGRRLIYVVLAIAVTAIVAIAVGIAAPQRFLSPADVALIGHMFAGAPRWDLPALETSGLTIALGNEPTLCVVLGVLAAVLLAARHAGKPRDLAEIAPRLSPGERVVAWALVAIAVVIGWPYLAVDDPQGLGFRLRIAAFVPMALCAGIVAGAVRAAIDRAVRPRVESFEHLLAPAVLAVLAAVLALRTPGDRDEGRVLTHPALVTSALALDGKIPAGDTAIVPERHIAFMVAWYARVPVSLRPEPVPPAHRWRVMPLAFIRAGSPLDDALFAARRERGLVPPLGVHPRHPNGLVVVAESTWAWILDHVPADERARLVAWPTI
jgi:hypothetical protein